MKGFLNNWTAVTGLLALALPMAAGMGVNFLLPFINRLFLGRYSDDALAASYPAGMLAYTVQGFFMTSASYLGSFAAQHHAADEDDEAGAMLAGPAAGRRGAAGELGAHPLPSRDRRLVRPARSGGSGEHG